MLWTALGFYAALGSAGLLWAGLAGAPLVGDPAAAVKWAVLGLYFGLAVVGLSRLLTARFAWARALSAWVAAQLTLELSWRNCALLAASSALGEELFFRAGMQTSLGLVPATVLFGLVHAPLQKTLLPWTAFALLFGLAAGAAYAHSGELAGPVAAHFLVNLLNLRALRHLRPAAASPADTCGP